jgi:predicted nucleotidyltransferase
LRPVRICAYRRFPELSGLPRGKSCAKLVTMERDHVIAALKAHEQELRTAGVESASLFGSVARGEDSANDVDVAVRLGKNFSAPGLQYFSRLSELEGHLSGILGCKVDVIEEPVRKKRFQTEIDRDRAIAF